MSLHKDVLIVNDDPAILNQVTELLDQRKISYLASNNAKEALGHANLYDFSLAFIDLDLPDMAADQFYQSLLEKESHYTLPIASFIDSLDSNEVAMLNKIVPLGQITLLSKPIKTEWLIKLLDRHLTS